MSRGILYIATGEEYIDKAVQSAGTVRQHMDVPIAIVTDRPLETDTFDYVIEVDQPEYSFADKPKYIRETPFNKTIFFDNDIALLDDISEMFKMLDQCDIAVSVDPYEAELRLNKQHSFADIPESVPIYQTGVIAFADTDTTNELFDKWWDIQKSTPIERDQASFRPALYRSDIDLLTFSHHYNFLTGWPIHAVGRVKVSHGVWFDDPETRKKVDKRLNSSEDLRFLFGIGEPESMNPSGPKVYVPTSATGNAIAKLGSRWLRYLITLNRMFRFTHRSIKQKGVIPTIKYIVDRFK